MGRLRDALCVFGMVLLTIVCGALLCFPLPKKIEGKTESFLCTFANGTTEEISDFSKVEILSVGRDEIAVEYDGTLGKVKTGREFLRAFDTFYLKDSIDILSFHLGECGRLEKMALFLLFQDTCVYALEPLCWDGTAFSPTTRGEFQTVMLAEGKISASFLRNSGAQRLILKSGAEFSASVLVGSRVSSVVAEPPYFTVRNEIYLQTALGSRLIAVLPEAESVTLSCDFVDEGALCACTALKKITFEKDYRMTLAMLFGSSPIPEGIEIEEIF